MKRIKRLEIILIIIFILSAVTSVTNGVKYNHNDVVSLVFGIISSTTLICLVWIEIVRATNSGN